MSRQVGMVFVTCTLLTGGARSVFAHHGGRDRSGAAEALSAYASAYVHSATHLTPTYARQTGLACSACHTHFPELTATGRAFKLNGYVFRRSESLEGKNPEGQQSLLLNLVAPVSLMFQTSYTSTKKALPGTQNGTVLFPDQLSLFTGGEITPHVGGFLQVTFDPKSGQFGAYRSAPLGIQRPLDSTATGVIKGAAPYWRVAFPNTWGQNYLSVGTYGIAASVFPAGVAGPTNRFTDVALDIAYMHSFGSNSFTLDGTWIHEKQTWTAGGAANPTNTLRSEERRVGNEGK